MILETKLTLPQPKAGALLRKGLIELIKNNLDKKLILITAGAGYGKTTLLAQLVKEARLPAVFYDLDKGDSDLTAFFEYLTHGLEKLAPGVAGRSLSLLNQGGEAGKNVELLMGTLINELVEKRKEEVFIALDDYQHLVENSSVHQALNYFIDRMPDIIHFIIASRSTVPLASLSKWLSKQDALVLTQNNLAFTGQEVKDLTARLYSRQADEDDLHVLLEHTEGWITGIQMILSQTMGQEHGRTIRDTLNKYLKTDPTGEDLFGYFANEIVSNETEPAKKFLIQSSVLETLTGEACNAVLEIDDAEDIIKNIEQRHLFISSLGHGEYRYHRLFRTYLQSRIGSEAEKAALHEKAAQYYRQKGMTEESIGHLLAAQNYEQAGKAIISIHEVLTSGARFALLNDWYRKLPDEVVNNNPYLLLGKAFLHEESGSVSEAERICKQVESLLDNMSTRKPADGKAPFFAQALLRQSRLLWMKGESARALPVIAKAQRWCPVSVVWLNMQILNFMGILLGEMGKDKKAITCLKKAKQLSLKDKNSIPFMMDANLANFYLQKGEVQKADAIFRSVFDEMQAEYFLRAGICYANIAKSALIMGDIDRAEKCLEKGMNVCRPYEDEKSRAALLNCFGLLRLHQGRWGEAQEHFNNALACFGKLQWKAGEIIVLQNLVRLCRYRCDLDKANTYLNMLQDKTGTKKTMALAGLIAEKALIEIQCGEYDKAGQDAKAGRSLSRKRGWKTEEFYALLADALVRSANGNTKQAATNLRRAVQLSKHKGYGGILARELSYNAPLLGLAHSLKPERGYLESLGIKMETVYQRLQVKCFGSLQVLDERGQPFKIDWPTKKAKSLFIYLVSHRNIRIDRDILIGNIWAELPFSQGLNNLRITVFRMRQALTAAFAGRFSGNDIFVKRHKSYRLLPQVQWNVDAEEFERQIKEAAQTEAPGQKAKLYGQALDAARDEYLPEINDLWAEQKRAEYDAQKLAAHRYLAGHAAQNEDYLSCVQACENYLVIDPLSEEMTRLCLESLNKLGRISEIKERYQILRQALHKELHCEPSQEIESFFNDLSRDIDDP